MQKYIRLITYNFDSYYSTEIFDTEKEALDRLQEDLQREIKAEELATGYIPFVQHYNDDDIVLFYADKDLYQVEIASNQDLSRLLSDVNQCHYRVIVIDV